MAYGHRLLGIDRTRSERYRTQIAAGRVGLKPGWVRLSIPYFASEADVSRSCQMIASGFWRRLRRTKTTLPASSLSPLTIGTGWLMG